MPAPKDNHTYASIIQEVVGKEPGIDWHSLSLDVNDPLYRELDDRLWVPHGELDDRLWVPYYDKAIEWFLKYFPHFTYQKEPENQALVILISNSYKWILDGYLTEIKNQANNTVLNKRDRINDLTYEQDRLKAMSHFSDRYSATLEKISALPNGIKFNYHSRLRICEEACLGANSITTEGLLIIDECLTRINLTTNERTTNTDLASTDYLTEKPKRVNVNAKEKLQRLLKKYDNYLTNGHSLDSALKALVHDFRLEYNPGNPSNRKKQIQRIIRNRNN
ncbi:hypothetical protein LC612_43145 [Nostoc sp. CHAB 5834]|nr:hypothetical protein [Nostoc sp. CHAB 5834]